MCFPSVSTPSVAATPPSPTLQAYSNTSSVENAFQDQQVKNAQQSGYQSTIATSGLGLVTPAPTDKKTLLGG